MTDIIKLGVNIAGFGVSLALFGIITKNQLDIPDKFMFAGMYTSMLSSLYRINVPRTT